MVLWKETLVALEVNVYYWPTTKVEKTRYSSPRNHLGLRQKEKPFNARIFKETRSCRTLSVEGNDRADAES